MKQLILFFAFFVKCILCSRDSEIGYTSWGTVKVPEKPIEFSYAEGDQNRTFNILSSNNFVGHSVD